MCKVRGSWFGEDVESRTCRSPEPRAGDGTNFGGRLIRESIGDPVRESRAKTCMNRRRSKGWFGNLSETQFGSHAWRHSRTDEEAKSKSCCPKKSGFWVWTSGRFVNMLDEKDILVCVHTRNIPWAWGCFWYVKVPSSPYKRGREGTCKRIQTFGNLSNLQRESQSLCALTLCLNVLRILSLVLGESSEFFG
jgi:hypothetical protein